MYEYVHMCLTYLVGVCIMYLFMYVYVYRNWHWRKNLASESSCWWWVLDTGYCGPAGSQNNYFCSCPFNALPFSWRWSSCTYLMYHTLRVIIKFPQFIVLIWAHVWTYMYRIASNKCPPQINARSLRVAQVTNARSGTSLGAGKLSTCTSTAW